MLRGGGFNEWLETFLELRQCQIGEAGPGFFLYFLQRKHSSYDFGRVAAHIGIGERDQKISRLPVLGTR